MHYDLQALRVRLLSIAATLRNGDSFTLDEPIPRTDDGAAIMLDVDAALRRRGLTIETSTHPSEAGRKWWARTV